MIQYPLDFPVFAKAPSGTNTQWISSAGLTEELTKIPCAIPVEFNGPGNGYSPEDLFALALVNCFIATFKLIAGASRLEYTHISGKAVLTVDRNESGKPWMDRCSFEFTLDGVVDREKAERLLNKTSSQCLIWNSVHTKKNFSFAIIESSQSKTDHL